MSTPEEARAWRSASSVKCPRPVAAREPKSVTLYKDASGKRFLNRVPALYGPIVWLEEGPCPIQ